MIYVYIAAFGFISIMFLNPRDIRNIGAQSLIHTERRASRDATGALALFGMSFTGNPGLNPLGLRSFLFAVYFNNKGKREDVSGCAPYEESAW